MVTSPLEPSAVSHQEFHSLRRGISQRLIITENKTCVTTPTSHYTSHDTSHDTSHNISCNISFGLNDYAKPAIHAHFTSYSNSTSLNPNARTFIPTNMFNCAIGAFFATILIYQASSFMCLTYIKNRYLVTILPKRY